MYPNLEERLFFNSVIEIETGCWIWIGYRCAKGYGQIGVYCPIKKKSRKHWAHRLSYQVFRGPIPPDREIEHTCHNPSCINPGHFELWTKSDNSRRLHSR